MAQKRHASEMETTTIRPRRESAKRTRLAPMDERDVDSSAPSSCSVSVDSALQSTPPASEQDRQSSMSSLEAAADSGEDGVSSVSSDSESDSDGSMAEDDDEVATIRTQKKPDFSAPSLAGVGDLQARLRAFLPQMADANARLDTEGAKGLSMEDVDDDGPHIEMNLGLGVLEEQGDGEEESDGSEEEHEQDGEDTDVPLPSMAAQKEKDVMGRLMGGRGNRKGGVEEVG